MTTRGGTGPVDDDLEQAAADHDDDWAWRRRVRSKPHTHRVYRIVVGVVGALIVLGGIVLLPAPGPGWVVIFIGLAVLASEFVWAQRVQDFAKRNVLRWTHWVQRQPLVVRLLIGLATLALVLGIFYLYFLWQGVPGFVPDGWVPDWSGLRVR